MLTVLIVLALVFVVYTLVHAVRHLARSPIIREDTPSRGRYCYGAAETARRARQIARGHHADYVGRTE